MLLSRAPLPGVARGAGLAWLSPSPIAVGSGRINRFWGEGCSPTPQGFFGVWVVLRGLDLPWVRGTRLVEVVFGGAGLLEPAGFIRSRTQLLHVLPFSACFRAGPGLRHPLGWKVKGWLYFFR